MTHTGQHKTVQQNNSVYIKNTGLATINEKFKNNEN